MQRIRWGILGCGDVTEVKSGPAFNLVTGSELRAVMRRDAAKAEDYAKRHSVPKWTADADALIHDPEIDAIYIATPPDSHCDYTIRVARAGKPVYVEKPMARNYSECEKMVAACREANVPLFVAYYRRCLPAFLKVRELVNAGAIGEVRFANIQLYHPAGNEVASKAGELPWRLQPEIAGAGLFFDLASHQLDYLDYVFGPITEVNGLAENQAALYAAEDVVCASFKFESGVVASGTWCFTVAEICRTDRIDIIGSDGQITFTSFDHKPVLLQTKAGVETFEAPPPKHIQQPLIQLVVDELCGRGMCPSTGETAARTSWVMDEVVRGYRERSSQR